MTHETLFLLAALSFAGPLAAQVDEPRTFELETADGVSVFAYEFADADTGSQPWILLFHQGGGSALGEYTPVVPRLRALGFNVLAIDQRLGGDLFEGSNRTMASLDEEAASYCDALPDLEAALDYARQRSPDRPAIVWGSSYSAALVIQLAAARPADVAGVLAFSPASGDPMEGCRPEPYAEALAVPLIAFRPQREAEIQSVVDQMATLRDQGHAVHVIDPGVHGSSMLVEARVRGDVSRVWSLVTDFLESVRPR